MKTSKIDAMLYVLKLEHEHFYVGFSARYYNERLLQHLRNDGSLWTKLHKPIGVIYVDKDGQKADENKLTLQVMEEYGWYNVRGGSWCKCEMKYPPKELSNRNNLKTFKPNCYRCGRKFHIAKDCRAKTDVHGNRLDAEDDSCDRCGRDSHVAEDCYAKTDIDGNELDAEDDNSALRVRSARSELDAEDESCDKCGRDSHVAEDCYAKKDINGKWLAASSTLSRSNLGGRRRL